MSRKTSIFSTKHAVRQTISKCIDALHEKDTHCMYPCITQADRIRKFASAQRASVTDTTTDIPGGQAGQIVSPIETAGCYAPGGR